MYPNEIDKFTEKLNKIDGNTYVIEEEVSLNDGTYEGELEHDNVSNSSVRVYTGSKLTGDKVENFILSTPSLTPWKRIIKIFSNVEKVYISYETPGDTIEAEDINKVQESIVNTQTEVDSYKSSNNLEVNNLKVRATNLENNKAEKTYVDIELNKRYLKTEVYTKSETDNRIQGIIGSAPTALDTLQEIAKSLNNDEDFAGTMVSELAKKVDKATGKQLSTEDYTTSEKTKLAGIETGANKYIHPSTHPANIIVEDSTHRFSSDAEKTNWNDANSKKHAHNNLSLLETITQTLVNAWNSAVEHIKDTVQHITQAERNKWNGKADISNIPTKVGQLENDKKYITQSELGNSGYGDMNKITYDTNGNGKVDISESTDSINFIDNRSSIDKPIDLPYRRLTCCFKSTISVGNPPVKANYEYVYILNIAGWNTGEGSGGWPIQLAIGTEGLAYRQAINADTWGAWKKILNEGCTWNNLKGV